MSVLRLRTFRPLSLRSSRKLHPTKEVIPIVKPRRLRARRKLVALTRYLKFLGSSRRLNVALETRSGSLIVVDTVRIHFAGYEVGPESVALFDDVLGEGGVLVPFAYDGNDIVSPGDFVVLHMV